MSKHQQRLDAIKATRARIQKKLDDMPDDQRVPQWTARIAEYDKAERVLELKAKISELEGTVVNVPTGQLNVEGQ